MTPRTLNNLSHPHSQQGLFFIHSCGDDFPKLVLDCTTGTAGKVTWRRARVQRNQMVRTVLRVAVLCAVALATVSGTSLTKDNFEELSSGKTVFVKFQAPWCSPLHS